MAWTEITPGHFQRLLGENEAFIKMIGEPGHVSGHEHWAINVDASIQAKPSDQLVEHLKDAWITLRFEHPSIAAVASATCIDYSVPCAETLEQWSSETFVVQHGTTRADVLAGMKPTPFVVLHVFPETSELLLHTSHWRTDGIGAFQLLDAYLALAATKTLPDPFGLPWGKEPSRLAPSIEAAANLALEPDAKIIAEADKWTKTFYEAAGAVGIDCHAGKETLPSGTRDARASFPESITEAIIKACKKRNISVTSAVHAALALTNWSFAAVSAQSKHYTSTIRVGLRPYLPMQFRTPAYAVGLYTSGYMYSLPAGRSFTKNSEEINGLYRIGLSADFLEAHRQYAVNLMDLIRNMPPDAPSPSDVDISNVGILDDMVKPVRGSLEVTRVGLGVEILSRQMTCFVWTFRNQLTFNLVYNEAFYPTETPNAFLKKLKEILVHELGLSV